MTCCSGDWQRRTLPSFDANKIFKYNHLQISIQSKKIKIKKTANLKVLRIFEIDSHCFFFAYPDAS